MAIDDPPLPVVNLLNVIGVPWLYIDEDTLLAFASLTQRAVVNLENWRGDLPALQKQFADWAIPGLKEVKAVTHDGEIVQIGLPPHQPMDVHPWLSNTD